MEYTKSKKRINVLNVNKCFTIYHKIIEFFMVIRWNMSEAVLQNMNNVLCTGGVY